MIANHIHDALAQVRKLQEFILEKRLFRGYSGKARIASGCAAMLGAAVMDSKMVPMDPFAHLVGWAAVVAVGIAINYGCLLYWFLFNPEVRGNPVMLKPALDAVPALGVGGVFTVAIVLAGAWDLLPGMWMCMYGLAQVAYRQSLPGGIYFVGIGYILCGTGCLAIPTSFLNPWPMGIVFLAGELAGGAVLVTYKTTAEKTDD